jgi:HPt (histidine-containing phosphotransfer) domain-containing protein
MTLLDRVHFSHMTGGDVALQQEVLTLFRGQVAAWSQLLSVDANWRDAAHTMKGSARGIGLWALADACEAAEAQDDNDASKVTVALAELRAALQNTLAALDACALGDAPH